METRPIQTLFVRILSLTLILVIAFSVTGSASAAGPRTFVGIWRAIDNSDGSLIRVTIIGPARGPFLITWTESYFSFCDGRAGLASGKGWLNPADPYVLEANMRLKCLRTGDSVEWHQVWQYRPTYHVLASQGEYGVETIWTRLGRPLVPGMGLRVNYGHDWVESFYEAGHTVWLTVKDNGGNVKATAELVTEPKDFWGGETGFQTQPSDWEPAPPDIQPLDWVSAQVDNGQTAQVQIGDITGMVDLAADSIEGTISAPWFPDEVEVECHSWGAPLPDEIIKYDMIQPNGEEPYVCSWAGEWDIQPYQDVGVGYSGPDGHWVANAFFARNSRIVASAAGDWFWTTDFYMGTLSLFIYEPAEEGGRLLWQGSRDADASGFIFVGYEDHGLDLLPGNYLVVSDGVNEKALVLETITMEVFDIEDEIMAGTAPAGRDVWAAAGPMDWQERLMVEADPVSGAWLADFKTIGFDITEEMRPWSYAHIYDEDGDANEANTPPPPPTPVILGWLDWDVVEGNGWEIGVPVTLTIGAFTRVAVVEQAPWDPFYGYVRFEVGAEGYDLKIGDVVVMTDGDTTKELLVPPLSITGYDLGAGTISGTYDPMLSFWINVNGMEPVGIDFVGDTWVATFDGLEPNMWGDAIQTDADGDDVRATIHTSNPNLYALSDEDKIFAQEWIAGDQLDLEIYNSVGEVIFGDSQMVEPPSVVPWTLVVFDLGAAGFDLSSGQRIVLNQGGYVRELLVSSLRITGFDYDHQQVIGTGDVGAHIFVRINGEDVWGEVDSEGNWAIAHPQLAPGVWGEAIQPDGVDGDETRDGFQAPPE